MDDERTEEGEAAFPSGEDNTRIYLNEIGPMPLLTPAEEQQLARAVRRGDVEARRRMIEANLRLVVSIAKRYRNHGLDFDDLIEEGNIGLMHAIGKFDPERGFRLSTYASWWIRQHIEVAIMNQSRTIRLPSHVCKRLGQVMRALRQLGAEAEDASRETLDAVAQRTGLSADEVREALQHRLRVASLDAGLETDSELCLGDAIADETCLPPEERLAAAEMREFVGEWLTELSDKERFVVAHRFGLGGDAVRTLDDLAREIGVSRERVRQIQIEALDRLHRCMRRRGVTREAAF